MTHRVKRSIKCNILRNLLRFFTTNFQIEYCHFTSLAIIIFIFIFFNNKEEVMKIIRITCLVLLTGLIFSLGTACQTEAVEQPATS